MSVHGTLTDTQRREDCRKSCVTVRHVPPGVNLQDYIQYKRAIMIDKSIWLVMFHDPKRKFLLFSFDKTVKHLVLNELNHKRLTGF